MGDETRLARVRVLPHGPWAASGLTEISYWAGSQTKAAVR